MSKGRIIEDYLADILNAVTEDVTEAEEFTRGMTYEEFAVDKKTINAVIRSLEVLGEATKRIPDDFRLLYPEVPWSKMAG